MYQREELGVPVLDLVADRLAERAWATSGPVRHLRFAGHGRVADVDVVGTSRLTLDVRLVPEEPTIVDVRMADRHGLVETRRFSQGPLTGLHPGLTSLLLRAPVTERKLAVTAWLGL